MVVGFVGLDYQLLAVLFVSWEVLYQVLKLVVVYSPHPRFAAHQPGVACENCGAANDANGYRRSIIAFE